MTQDTIVQTVQDRAVEATFKSGIDTLLAGRKYFIEKVLPILKENQDYFIILQKKSLAKGGAEKLATIFNLTAQFAVDRETMELLKQEGLVAYVCNLMDKEGNQRGQGRGADTLGRNKADANKTIKMAQKRAYVDAVIRATGLSDIFTQDLEDNQEEKRKYAPRKVVREREPVDSLKIQIKKLCDDFNPLLTTKEDYEGYVVEKTQLELKPENYEEIISRLTILKQESYVARNIASSS